MHGSWNRLTAFFAKPGVLIIHALAFEAVWLLNTKSASSSALFTCAGFT